LNRKIYHLALAQAQIPISNGKSAFKYDIVGDMILGDYLKYHAAAKT